MLMIILFLDFDMFGPNGMTISQSSYTIHSPENRSSVNSNEYAKQQNTGWINTVSI